MEIIRGTTPTLMYTFSDINAGDIVYAYLLMKQPTGAKVEKYLEDATVQADTQTEKGYLAFNLSQAETLSFTSGKELLVSLDWKISDGTRGRSNVERFQVTNSGKDEVV